MRLMLFLILGYLLLVAVIFITQRQLLYFPTTQLPSDKQLQSLALQLWPSEKTEYQALLAEPDSRAQGTMIIFHGNAGSASDRNYYISPLVNSGYRVLLAEYPGYGGRKGSPSETVIVADAIRLTQRVIQTFSGPIFLWGESLGAGVAAAVASEIPEVDGLVLITPWDKLANVASRHYWYFPVRWLLKDRFDSVANLKDYSNPTAVLLAEQDEIIPPQHAKMLFEQLQQPKQLWVFAGVGHNTWPIYEKADWWQEVLRFISSQSKNERAKGDGIDAEH